MWVNQKFCQAAGPVVCADRSRGQRKLSEGHADMPFEAKLAALLTKIVPPVADGPRADAHTRKSPACPPFTGGVVRRVLSKMPS